MANDHQNDDYESVDFYARHGRGVKDGFSKFQVGDKYYFCYYIDGEIFLISQAYTGERGRDNGVESVKKNAKLQERFRVGERKDGRAGVSLIAGNHQEIAVSGPIASKAKAQSLIAGMSGSVISGGTRKKTSAPQKKTGPKPRLKEQDYRPLAFYERQVDASVDGFTTFLGDDGFHYFTYNIDGYIELISEGYNSEAAMLGGVDSVIANMPDENRYEFKRYKSGKRDYRIKARNGKEIARSVWYDSAEGARLGAGDVRAFFDEGQSSASGRRRRPWFYRSRGFTQQPLETYYVQKEKPKKRPAKSDELETKKSRKKASPVRTSKSKSSPVESRKTSAAKSKSAKSKPRLGGAGRASALVAASAMTASAKKKTSKPKTKTSAAKPKAKPKATKAKTAPKVATTKTPSAKPKKVKAKALAASIEKPKVKKLKAKAKPAAKNKTVKKATAKSASKATAAAKKPAAKPVSVKSAAAKPKTKTNTTTAKKAVKKTVKKTVKRVKAKAVATQTTKPKVKRVKAATIAAAAAGTAIAAKAAAKPKSVKPVETIKKVEPVKRAEPVRPVEPVKPAEPIVVKPTPPTPPTPPVSPPPPPAPTPAPIAPAMMSEAAPIAAKVGAVGAGTAAAATTAATAATGAAGGFRWIWLLLPLLLLLALFGLKQCWPAATNTVPPFVAETPSEPAAAIVEPVTPELPVEPPVEPPVVEAQPIIDPEPEPEPIPAPEPEPEPVQAAPATPVAVASPLGTCGPSNVAIFSVPYGAAPKNVTRLGTYPQFGDSHGLTPVQFYEKLQTRFQSSDNDRRYLNYLFKSMGFRNGFADARPEYFSEETLPQGTKGLLGYADFHGYEFSQLNVSSPRDLQAFRIQSANGTSVYFMKTCGNYMYVCK